MGRWWIVGSSLIALACQSNLGGVGSGTGGSGMESDADPMDGTASASSATGSSATGMASGGITGGSSGGGSSGGGDMMTTMADGGTTGPGEGSEDETTTSTTEPPPPVDAYPSCEDELDCNELQPICEYYDIGDGEFANYCAQPCDDESDCTIGPDTGDSVPWCDTFAGACYLDCTGGLTCPDGMQCLPYGGGGGYCAWVSER